jgi:D-alanyl-D-alanine carboxypeptidase (penicillin-binding protein 5/6)
VAAALAPSLVGAKPAAAAPPAPTIDARAWVVIDADDGTRLAARDPDRELSIASTTKLMTAYLTLRDLPLGRSLVVPAYHPIPGESLLGLDPGERDTVHDLLYGLLLPSGNDAAVTLADGVAGSVPAFVERMNRTAARLGLRHTHYATPVGLDRPGNYSTAADLARLARILMRDPRFRRIVNSPSKTLRSGAEVRHVENRNDLLTEEPWVDGVKTGYTPDARNVLVAAGRLHGIDLISAVLGAPTEYDRDQGSLQLLRYGYSLYRRREPIRRGQVLARPRERYWEARARLVAARAVRVWARRDERVAVRVRAPREVVGPIRRGRRLGRATVLVEGHGRRIVPLRTGRSVPAPPIPSGIAALIPGSPPAALAVLAAALGLAAAVALALRLGAASERGRLPARRRG